MIRSIWVNAGDDVVNGSSFTEPSFGFVASFANTLPALRLPDARIELHASLFDSCLGENPFNLRRLASAEVR